MLKGGNALRFAFGSVRSTIDLDFTAEGELSDSADAVRDELDRAMRSATRIHGIAMKCQRVKRNPSRPESTLPTYDVRLAYQYPGDRHFADFERARNVSTVVRVEISFNDLVCESREYQPSEHAGGSIRVCTLEDIMAEKLRAILQQEIRNRSRPQDVYDVARAARGVLGALDLDRVASFLIAKSAARDIAVRKTSFGQEARRRAADGYDARLGDIGDAHIPFDEAWLDVLGLIAKLDLPD